MTSWQEFALALGAFMLSHLLPRVGGLRGTLIRLLGRRAYFALYGLASLILLGWVISAAGRAPYIELWPQAPWTRWVPFVATPIAFVLAACGIGAGLPGSLGASRRRKYDPAHPGFAAITRHPVLLALTLWALAHLPPNGDLSHVVLFGLFALFSLLAMPAFDRRALRTIGPGAFAGAPILSLRPVFDHAWWQENTRPVMLRGAVGVLLWCVALHLHASAIGAWPFPG